MSPLGATTTSDGPLNVSGPSPATPGLPERHQDLAVGAELEDLLALPVFVLRVGHPDVAVAIDRHPVRLDEHPVAEARESFFPIGRTRMVGSLRWKTQMLPFASGSIEITPAHFMLAGSCAQLSAT